MEGTPSDRPESDAASDDVTTPSLALHEVSDGDSVDVSDDEPDDGDGLDDVEPPPPKEDDMSLPPLRPLRRLPPLRSLPAATARRRPRG